MKDGPLRIVLKRIALAGFTIDLAATRAIRRAKGDRPYRLGGDCALCAKCCESPTIQTGPFIANFRTLRGAFLAWHKHVNGFELIDYHPRQRLFVFRCTHFDPETRQCDS